MAPGSRRSRGTSERPAAAAIAAGVHRALPGAVVREVPLVDGGEGSARTLAAATGGRIVPVTVTGPVGKPVALFSKVEASETYAPRDLLRLSAVLAPVSALLVLFFSFVVWPLLGLPLSDG